MGKKKKVDINGKPLEAVTIGRVKDNKYGWIGVLFLFALFIGIIYFLPELNKMYQEYMSGSSAMAPSGMGTTNNTVVNPNEDETGENEETTETYYKFGTDLNVTVDDLEFTAISYINNVLTFNVTNSGSKNINLDELELYFSTYDNNTEENMILNSVAIKGSLVSEATKEYSFNIKEGALYFNIKQIPEEEYTYIDLVTDEAGNAILKCTKDREELTYTFVDNKLNLVNHSNIVYKDSENYSVLYEEYNNMVVRYGDVNGVNAKLSELSSYLWYKLQVDYSQTKDKIDYEYYFDKETTPRVVNFIMESVLFECS
ncbi:MAG: hypothetical protein IJO63_03440 [Bacilli bacterium]|nr:hypothetical protein [Bacilli bacterium]